jgi:hypothetical protein
VDCPSPTQDDRTASFSAAAEPFRSTPVRCRRSRPLRAGVEEHMNGIIYLIGLIVVVLAILSFLGLR